MPDWICEVISPSSVRRDRVTKMALYARLQLQYLWLIDPIAQTLEAYQLQEGHWLLLMSYADDQPVSIAPFAAHTFPLDILWE
jgi:Uma2 family endonuclease